MTLPSDSGWRECCGVRFKAPATCHMCGNQGLVAERPKLKDQGAVLADPDDLRDPRLSDMDAAL